MAANGGRIDYDDSQPKSVFFRASDRETKTVTVKQGQVLKAKSFVESDANGKMIAATGLVESATVLINAALANTNTMTVGTGGIVFTVGSAGATVAQLVAALDVLTPGATTTIANAALLAAGIATTVGTFTSGTAPAFEFSKVSATTALAKASAAGNVTDLAVTTSTGTAPTVTVTSGASYVKPAAVLLYDVNATSADVEAAAWVEASFWSDALVWAVDPTVDYVTNADGTTTYCTTYNTGCAGTTAASNLLKAKFVEGTEFEPMGFIKTGEVY